MTFRRWRRAAAGLLGLVVAGLSAPARSEASTVALRGMPYVSQALTAYAGYVVFSQQSGADATYRLTVWHRGRTRALPVAARSMPFDADAGSDASGRPVVVFSRCARDPPSDTLDWTAARGCRIYELSLLGGAPRRVGAIGAPGRSDSTPTIWFGSIAFARLAPGSTVARIYLWRPRRRLEALGGGSPPCVRRRPCRPGTSGPPEGYVAAMDLGARQLAFTWIVQGSSVVGIGAAPEMRTDSLAGDRAELADSGYTSGACGGAQQGSPNVVGASVLYLNEDFDCDGSTAVSGGEETHSYFEAFAPAFRSFGYTSPAPPTTRYRRTGPPSGLIGALAWDGSATYWLRVRPTNPRTDQFFVDTSDCSATHSVCELMRTSGVFGRLRDEPHRTAPLPQGF
jgi:hypothetical protein